MGRRHSLTVEIDLDDLDEDELVSALAARGGDIELIIQLDAEVGDWEFTRKIRDWAVAEMAKHEATLELVHG